METFIRAKYERKLYTDKSSNHLSVGSMSKGMKSKSADNLLEKTEKPSSIASNPKPFSSPKAARVSLNPPAAVKPPQARSRKHQDQVHMYK